MTTHDDLNRDLGRMEARQDAMADDITEIKTTVKAILARLDAQDSRESERKGAWKTLVAMASLIGGAVAWFFSHLPKWL